MDENSNIYFVEAKEWTRLISVHGEPKSEENKAGMKRSTFLFDTVIVQNSISDTDQDVHYTDAEQDCSRHWTCNDVGHDNDISDVSKCTGSPRGVTNFSSKGQ